MKVRASVRSLVILRVNTVISTWPSEPREGQTITRGNYFLTVLVIQKNGLTLA